MMNTQKPMLPYCKYTFAFSCSLHYLDFMLICTFRLYYGFERVSFIFLVDFSSTVITFFISLSSFVISIEIPYLKQLIDFYASSLLSISFHFFQTSIFHSISPHFFSSNSTLRHNFLADLPRFCDSYIFHLTSRTLSFVWFDQIFQFIISPLSHFDFDHEGAVPIKLQSLIQLYQFINCFSWGNLAWDSYLSLWMWTRIDLMFKGLLFMFFQMWSWVDLTSELFCDSKSTSHCNFILWLHVILSWPHISQRGANVCNLKWSPRLWAPFI